MDLSLHAARRPHLQAQPRQAGRAAGGRDRRRHKFWDAYAAQLLADPTFRVDDDATITFGKLAYNHADLYRWRNLPKDEEYFLKLAVRLSPQLQDAVLRLNDVYVDQGRYDEAIALMRQARRTIRATRSSPTCWTRTRTSSRRPARRRKLRAQLATSPYDLALNLQLARALQEEGKTDEVAERLRIAAALTNWNHDEMAGVVQYYVDEVHDVPAAIAFLQVRAKLEPKNSKLVYSLAALEASLDRADDAVRDLARPPRRPTAPTRSFPPRSMGASRRSATIRVSRRSSRGPTAGRRDQRRAHHQSRSSARGTGPSCVGA